MTQPNSKTDRDLIQSVLSKATQVIQNERDLFESQNDTLKKNGVSAHLITQYHDIIHAMQHRIEILMARCGQNGVDADDILNVLKVYHYKIKILEESPEYGFISSLDT